jgi:hypothetical protein
MIAKRDGTFFVTIRHQNSGIPVFDKVEIFVSAGDNMTKIAKRLRLDACSRYTPRLMRPSILSWAIFWNVDDREPMLKSTNWR